MIGKVIAYGDTREQAIARMRIALSEMVVEGIKTNIPLHQELLLDEKFLRGGTSIHYLEERLAKKQGRRLTLLPPAGRAPMACHALDISRFASTPSRARRRAGATRCSTPARCRSTSPIRTPARRTRRRLRRAGRGGRPPLADVHADRAVRRRRGRRGCAGPPRAALAPADCRRFAIAERRREDWVRETQAQFAPIRIADGLWIVPSWCEPPDPAAVNIALDPGLAFGTGSHPTTRLCLRWLASELRAGGIGARLRLRLRHPGDRGGEARCRHGRRHRRRSAGDRRQRRQRRAPTGRARFCVPADARRGRARVVRRRGRQHPRQSAAPARAAPSPRGCGRAAGSCCPASSSRRPTR